MTDAERIQHLEQRLGDAERLIIDIMVLVQVHLAEHKHDHEEVSGKLEHLRQLLSEASADDSDDWWRGGE